jgi:hypothetical protein
MTRAITVLAIAAELVFAASLLYALATFIEVTP